MIPPTVGHPDVDPKIDLDVVLGAPRRPASVDVVLSNSFGFGGPQRSVVLRRFSSIDRAQQRGDERRDHPGRTSTLEHARARSPCPTMTPSATVAAAAACAGEATPIPE